MPLTYEVDTGRGLLRVTAEGDTASAEWMALLEALQAEPSMKGEMPILVDVRRHRTVVPTDFIWAVAGQTAHDQARGARWAIVSNRTVSQGMAMMLATLVEKAGVQVRFFGEIEEAESWLLS